MQNTIEFVLSIHPSNSPYDATADGQKGAAISHEALNEASRLLSAPPYGVSQDRWFSAIAPQLFSLLQGEGQPEMDKAAAFIIGFGILGRKQYGAPGKPGWRAFVQPMLHGIDPATFPAFESSIPNKEGPIVTLGASKILVPSDEVAKSLQRLTALLSGHPNPALTIRLLRPVLLPLWSLASWQDANESIDSRYRTPARNLVRIFLQLSPSGQSSEKARLDSSPANLLLIVHNLMFKGRSKSSNLEWVYVQSRDGGIQIQEFDHNAEHKMLDLGRIDRAAQNFIDLIKLTPDLVAEISNLFMIICKKWLNNGDKKSSSPIITLVRSTESNDDIENSLVEAKILQKMMTEIPEMLVNNSRQVLDLVDQILSQYTTMYESDNEDTPVVALSLLNTILTSPTFRASPENKLLLEHIQKSLDLISRRTHLDISSTARNIVTLMRFRTVTAEPSASAAISRSDQQDEDRKSYNLALSYLTTTDSPPPVRVQGLELISKLVRVGSPVLDVPALSVLLSSLLQDGEEYMYLRAIKSFIQLSERHPKAIMKDLLERYVDTNEDYELDHRLRLGEALLQVIEISGRALIGEVASSVSKGLLSVAGRRRLRPKTERAQERKHLLERKKNIEAEEAWDGEIPQLDELMEDEATEDYDTILQIVSGWESKRGTEDVRIRASALSILAAAIGSNVTGIGSTLISNIIDLSIHVLTLEPEPENGILRRSAILLVMSFIQALDSARVDGKRLGFGFVGQSLDDIQRVLKYVANTDNDGLVRRHADDVVDSLQDWQITQLLPRANDKTDIEDLAGLSSTPGDGYRSRIRPRIEEIE